MAVIKAIATVQNFTSGDDGLGIDYQLDVVQNTWRDHIDIADEQFYLYPNNDTVTSEQIWYGIAGHAMGIINTALVAAGQAASCVRKDVIVPGFGDWKFGNKPEKRRRVQRGQQRRAPRMPKAVNDIVYLRSTAEEIRMDNLLATDISAEVQFTIAPTLGVIMEYRLYIYTMPALIGATPTDNILLGTVTTGPPYKLSGTKAISAMVAGIQTAEYIQTVVGIKRLTTATFRAKNAGKIDNVEVTIS